MRLLQLAHRLPYPPIDGGKKGTLGFVEGYRRHRQVSSYRLICMCPQEEQAWARQWQAEGMPADVEIMDARNSVPRFVANTLFSRQPFNMEKYRRAGFARRIESALQSGGADVVHFDSLHTAAYVPLVRRLAPQALRVLRCHNAEHLILERLAQNECNPLRRWPIALQARRLKAYEARALSDFDLVLAITQADADRFLAMAPDVGPRMIVLPAGADVPQALPAAPADEGGVIRLLHVAAMDWLPNQTALRWLIQEVLPHLDRQGLNYHLDVAGKNMPAEFHAFAGPRVSVHGFVEDLRALTRAAHLGLVPLQVGGGMRVKILDYWAAGVPVVSTRIGAEGLYAGQSTALALADTPEEMAASIVGLATDAPARQTLREAAFKLVRDRYGWPSLIDRVIGEYQGRLHRTAQVAA